MQDSRLVGPGGEGECTTKEHRRASALCKVVFYKFYGILKC